MIVPIAATVVLGGALTVAAYTDCRWGIIPNWLTYPGMLAGLAFWAVAGWATDGWASAGAQAGGAAVALLVGLVPFMVLRLIGVVGGGDAKLMGLIGAWTGMWQSVVATVFYSCFIVLAMAVIVMVVQGKVRQTAQRIWLLLVSSAAGARDAAPSDSPRLPFGLALALAGLLAALEHVIGLELPWSRYSAF